MKSMKSSFVNDLWFKIWGTYAVTLVLAIILTPNLHQQTLAYAKHFECPQQFGYYADGSDCNKYFVCVFGDALLEKCTPGLFFNDELRMCDWPRNVKNCDREGRSDRGFKSGSAISEEKRRFGTTTSRPRSSNRNRNANKDDSDSIPNPNSIAPAHPTRNSRYQSRYTPSINNEYRATARNATHVHLRPMPAIYIKPSTSTVTSTTPKSTPKPRSFVTHAIISYKPITYQVTQKPRLQTPQEKQGPRISLISNKRKDYEDDVEYYDDEDYEDDEEPEMTNNKNGNPHNRNIGYVSSKSPSTQTQRFPMSHIRETSTRPSTRHSVNTYSSVNYYNSQERPSNVNNNFATNNKPRTQNSRPVYITLHNRNRNINPAQNSIISNSASRNPSTQVSVNSQNRNNHANRHEDSREDSSENPRGITYTIYTSNNNNRNRQHVNKNSALPEIHLRPQVNRIQSHQTLDNNEDSLDAQFGTNPRSISLPDSPYRLNSFVSNNEARKAEKNQVKKHQVTSTKYLAPPKQTYQTGTSQPFDEYPEYYYDYEDDEYEDDDDDSLGKPVPKVVIRLQKPVTTPKPTRATIATTTRRITTTTRRPPPTRPAKRPLPFGISRPATKSPPRFGPKPLPKLPSRPPPVYTTPRALSVAEKCSPHKCVLPDCRCGAADIPGSLQAHQVPQIVLITFDDAVNDLNYELYSEIFENRKNPNGCPILGTFYVSHEWTDYGMVQSLYSKGHEMASHSITHSHGEKFSVNHWIKEINGQREILHLYGGVKLEDIRGMRAPFLQVGGNNMFEMLYDTNFTYDSSMPVLDNKPPFYPYTLDYALGHECMIPPCPTKSFPGLWEVGMVMWNDYRGGRCSMGDACANPDNAEDVYKMLLKNFNRHYNSNRAPFGLFYHAAWFTTQHFRKGYMKFIDEINSKNDVYMVTNWQAIQWMRKPTPLSHIKSFKPWQCPKDPERPGPCHHPTTCNISYKGGNRNMRTCQPCPSSFPWSGRTGFDEVYG